jgi:ABC-type dipeptide/oligopeptide/nickel transport system ATPase component
MTKSSPAPVPLLAVRDLAVWFESRTGATTRAVDGVSLAVYPGQTLAIVGESGCGKSVTAMSLLRLLPSPPARYVRGSASLAAPEGGLCDLMRLSDREIRAVRGSRIAMIFQEPMTSLNPVFTVGEQRDARPGRRQFGRWSRSASRGPAIERVPTRTSSPAGCVNAS